MSLSPVQLVELHRTAGDGESRFSIWEDSGVCAAVHHEDQILNDT